MKLENNKHMGKPCTEYVNGQFFSILISLFLQFFLFFYLFICFELSFPYDHQPSNLLPLTFQSAPFFWEIYQDQYSICDMLLIATKDNNQDVHQNKC